MPEPSLRDTVPYWLRPENASVLDSSLTKAARTIASLTGINDPQSQIWALLKTLIPETGASVQSLDGLTSKAPAQEPTIGAARVGDRYIPPSFAEIMTSRNPAQGIAENILGPARPRSVQALDPYGAEAYLAGTGPAPGFMLGATEAVGGPRLSDAALAEVKALFPRLDAYSKPTSLISAKTIAKRLAAAPRLSDEARQAVSRAAEQVGDRRVAANEFHALAAGTDYTPDRVLRKVKAPIEGQEQRPGAPLGVTNARQEAARREQYMQQMAEGAVGRTWYEDAGWAIKFYANDDPQRALQLAEDIAITSPATSVSANTGFGVKGYNQATAGVPVEAGRFPTAMGQKITEGHSSMAGLGGLGLKRTPFADNLARGGEFFDSDRIPRAVHDIWEGEAYGYVNPDGTPLRRGFTPAEHTWMDDQTTKIIAEANKRGVGGHTDWDVKRAQAAAWVAAKVRAGEIKPIDAAKSYASFFPELAAQGSREVTPGRTTGHMPQLLKPDADKFRQFLHDMVTSESGIYDTKGRDQIAAGYGGLVGQSFDGPGVFGQDVNPGRQSIVLTGSLETPGSKGARVLDEGSRRILDASEATYGLLSGQDAAAYSRVLPAGSGQPRNAWEVTLPSGTITKDTMETLLNHLGPSAKDVVLVPTPSGVRLAFMDEKTMKSAVKAIGGKVETSGTLQGNLISNDWTKQQVGQGYFDAIRKMGTEKFDAFAPGMAQRLRDIDARFSNETNGKFTLSPVLDEVRAAIAGEGFAGLERLAKKYAIPTALLAAGLVALQEPAPHSGSASSANGDAQQ